jgi:hypothetical protein
MAVIRDPGDTSPDIDQFNLPSVLRLVRPLGCSQPDLFDYLRLGHLHAVCFPYRLEPARQVAIEPDEWPEWYRDSYAFPVYDSHIGELDVAEHEIPVPLHIVPRAARADCERVLMDGGKAAQNAVVYVLRDELVRFTKWLGGAIPNSQHGPPEPAENPLPKALAKEPLTLHERAVGWLEEMKKLREADEAIPWNQPARRIARSSGADWATVAREARRIRKEQDRAGRKSGE